MSEKYVHIPYSDGTVLMAESLNRMGEAIERLDAQDPSGESGNGGAGQILNNNAEIFNNYEDNIASGEYAHAEGSNAPQTIAIVADLGNNTYITDTHRSYIIGIEENNSDGSLQTGTLIEANGVKTYVTKCEDVPADKMAEYGLEFASVITTAESLGAATSAILCSAGATGFGSHVEGTLNSAIGNGGSHAEGSNNIASGASSHAEGRANIAGGGQSHAEGRLTVALGRGAHAEGGYTKASGAYAHVEGESCEAIGRGSHAEGAKSQSIGQNSHAEGNTTIAMGQQSHTEGYLTTTTEAANHAHAEGYNTIAASVAAHAEGAYTKAEGARAHAEGENTTATGNYSHAEGYHTIAMAEKSHAEGDNTVVEANAVGGHAEGIETSVSNAAGHAEGHLTITSGLCGHAEGRKAIASGHYSHAEGNETQATSEQSHAEGMKTTSSGYASHAEGSGSQATGYAAHAEGYNTKATGSSSHAEGCNTLAAGARSHASGEGTIARGNYQTVIGKYNADLDRYADYAFIIGCGTKDTDRKDAFGVEWDGSFWSAGDFHSFGNIYSTDGKLATEKFVLENGGSGSGDVIVFTLENTKPSIPYSDIYNALSNNKLALLYYNNHIYEPITFTASYAQYQSIYLNDDNAFVKHRWDIYSDGADYL